MFIQALSDLHSKRFLIQNIERIFRKIINIIWRGATTTSRKDTLSRGCDT